jgi:hypothetical protein
MDYKQQNYSTPCPSQMQQGMKDSRPKTERIQGSIDTLISAVDILEILKSQISGEDRFPNKACCEESVPKQYPCLVEILNNVSNILDEQTKRVNDLTSQLRTMLLG